MYTLHCTVHSVWRGQRELSIVCNASQKPLHCIVYTINTIYAQYVQYTQCIVYTIHSICSLSMHIVRRGQPELGIMCNASQTLMCCILYTLYTVHSVCTEHNVQWKLNTVAYWLLCMKTAKSRQWASHQCTTSVTCMCILHSAHLKQQRWYLKQLPMKDMVEETEHKTIAVKG